MTGSAKPKIAPSRKKNVLYHLRSSVIFHQIQPCLLHPRFQSPPKSLDNGYVYTSRAVHSGGAKGAVAPARKTKCFFSNIVSDFAGLFLVAILVRNLTKTEFAPADKKS